MNARKQVKTLFILLAAFLLLGSSFSLPAYAMEEIEPEVTVEESFTVLFDPNDGTDYKYEELSKVTVRDGEKIPADPVAPPERPGYVFAGWTINGDNETERMFWDFENEQVEFNLTLWASWDKMHTVLFDPNDGTDYKYEELPRVTVRDGEKIPADPVAPPERPGYVFAGWTINGDNETERMFWDFENGQVEFNLTLWASWDKMHTVLFDPNDGTDYKYEELPKVTVRDGEKIPADPVAPPERPGYVFAGWTINGDNETERMFWNFENEQVEFNLTLWASWDMEGEDGNNSGGEPEGGNNSGGEPQDGNNSGGEPEDGNTSGGEPEDGNTSGGEPEDGNTSGGEPEDGNTSGGEPEGGNTSGGEPEDGNTSGGEPEGGNTSGGEPEDSNTSGGEPEDGDSSEGQPEDSHVVIDPDKFPAGSSQLDQVPLTGDAAASWRFHTSVLLVSLIALAVLFFCRRKTV